MKKRLAAVLILALSMILAGCSSSVSQAEYDALLSENEALKEQLAQYEGTSAKDQEPAATGSNSEYDPNAEPADESDFLYVNNGSEVQINGYQGAGGYVVIPNEIEGVPVTRIADGAFYGAENITGIVLPEKLQYIGDNAFNWLENISSVLVIPETVETIGSNAFNCTNITGLVIGADCEMDVGAFCNANSLEFIYVREGCSPKIEYAAFSSARALKTAVFPESVSNMTDEAFEGCNILTIYTPQGSFAEEYANRNFVKVDTANYDSQASSFKEIYG